MSTFIENPAAYFLALGGVHDGKFDVTYNQSDKTMTIHVDDINANLFGLPAYPGKYSANFIFSDVENARLDFDTENIANCRIYELKIKREVTSKKDTLTMSISPGGLLVFDFTTLSQD